MNDRINQINGNNIPAPKDFDHDPHVFTLKPEDEFVIITKKEDILEECHKCGNGYHRRREGLSIINLKGINQSFMVKREPGMGMIIFALPADFEDKV